MRCARGDLGKLGTLFCSMIAHYKQEQYLSLTTLFQSFVYFFSARDFDIYALRLSVNGPFPPVITLYPITCSHSCYNFGIKTFDTITTLLYGRS